MDKSKHLNKVKNGLYQGAKGWFYQIGINHKTARGGPYVCPVFALIGRMALKKRDQAEKLRPYIYECGKCKKPTKAIKKCHGRRKLFCLDCANERKETYRKISKQRKGRPTSVNLDIKKRLCLVCGKWFMSKGPHNRICEKNGCVNRPDCYVYKVHISKKR